MDLGRIGLFIVIGGISIYYGLSQGRISMMILGIIIAGVGIVNSVIIGMKKKNDKKDK
ncbi:MAG: hypothetical protein JEZ04_07650 [Spirochaetales bacterium]|nr:hypothetical protein [Spirochaetales bacterium]